MAGALFRTKSIDRLCPTSHGTGEDDAQADPRSVRAGRARHRRDHRRRAVRAHRRRDRRAVGSVGDARVHRRRRRLRLRRPLLRRVRVDDSDRRQRLHLLLRDDGRARRLDHRLGPDASSTRSAPRRSRSRGASTSTRCSSTSACTSRTNGAIHRSRRCGGTGVARHHQHPGDLHPRCSCRRC